MKVAVVGSGLAGLTTAYLLRREGVEVWLIEKSEALGFHSHSVTIPTDEKGVEAGPPWVVDVPMRGFQGGYYPLLLSLYHHLGLPIVAKDYTFSFSSPISTYFIHSGASGLSVPSFPANAFANPLTFLHAIITFLGVALCYILLLALSLMAWHNVLPRSLSSPDLTLRDFTTQISTFLARPITLPVIRWSPFTPLGNAFEHFIAKIVLPLFSSVGTMSSSDVWSLPARVIFEYVHTTLGTSHYHLAKGHSAADVARLLSEPVRNQPGLDHVRLGTEITALKHDPCGGIRVELKRREQVDDLVVDKVVLATQASVARWLLQGYERDLRDSNEVQRACRAGRIMRALGDVTYRETIVVTHRDTTILPRPSDRRDLNFFLPTASSSSSQSLASYQSSLPADRPDIPYFSPKLGKLYTMATQIVPHPQGKQLPVLQTTNPVMPINPDKVLSVSRLERALPLTHPRRTLTAIRSNAQEVHIAGSYAYPGIPLLEGCVGSAKLAVEAILHGQSGQHEEGGIAQAGTGRHIGEIDWDHGRGGWVERMWRWRWQSSEMSVWS
ncbi:hypothetical protein IAU60_005502 [Kwoniella sp. DSM 27419]